MNVPHGDARRTCVRPPSQDADLSLQVPSCKRVEVKRYAENNNKCNAKVNEESRHRRVGRSADVVGLYSVRGAGSGHGSRLFDDALELVDNLGGDLVPQKTAGVDLGGRFTLALLAHGS